MTYYKDTASNWVADQPVTAWVTRQGMQDNLLTCAEQSGSDIDCGCLGSSTETWIVPSNVNWFWIQVPVTLINVPATPIRAIRNQGSTAWRDISVRTEIALSLAGSVSVRIFLLPYPIAVLNQAGGTVGGFDFVQFTVNNVAMSIKGGVITPSEVDIMALEGISFPIVWMHVAVKGDQNLVVNTIRHWEDGA